MRPPFEPWSVQVSRHERGAPRGVQLCEIVRKKKKKKKPVRIVRVRSPEVWGSAAVAPGLSAFLGSSGVNRVLY